MSDDNMFSEVEDELRSERMRNMWRKFAPLIIGAAVAIVVVVAAKEGWTAWQKSISSTSSDQFYSAVDLADENDIAGARAAFDIVVTEASGQYPLLAEFRQAALLLAEGKNAEAATAYDNIANSMSNKRLRDLALIFAASALIDGGDVAAVEARVIGLITPDNSMRNRAKEIIGLTQYAGGDINGARATFETIIADPSGSPDSIGRVQTYITQLAAQGAKAPASDISQPAVSQ